jgi:hypothetical protein
LLHDGRGRHGGPKPSRHIPSRDEALDSLLEKSKQQQDAISAILCRLVHPWLLPPGVPLDTPVSDWCQYCGKKKHPKDQHGINVNSREDIREDEIMCLVTRDVTDRIFTKRLRS